MTKIKFGTDGWRAIIGKEYTSNNVARVSIAVADWLNEKYDKPSVVINTEEKKEEIEVKAEVPIEEVVEVPPVVIITSSQYE